MSIEAVNQFLQKVTEDASLQEELAKALDSENDRQAATDLGAKYGYMFTPEELGTEIQNRQSEFQRKQNNGELSEKDLEAVAGGGAAIAIGSIGNIGLVNNNQNQAGDRSKW
jgi:predicted ribosomally synthesized peptide with nif11-like leader